MHSSLSKNYSSRLKPTLIPLFLPIKYCFFLVLSRPAICGVACVGYVENVIINQKEIRMVSFSPQQAVVFVSPDGVQELGASEISPDLVGHKAYGLTCIPAGWTKPYLIISSRLFETFARSLETESHMDITPWVAMMRHGMERAGLSAAPNLIFRSSGMLETLRERGLFCSRFFEAENLEPALLEYMTELSGIAAIEGHSFAILLQEYIISPRKGHLSNERAFSPHTRDWIIEEELEKAPARRLALRDWREEFDMNSNPILMFNGEHALQKLFKIPAFFAHMNKRRIHYEWVIQDKFMYIVQADEEDAESGESPSSLRIEKTNKIKVNEYSVLKHPTDVHYNTYPKIKNVSIYKQIGYDFPNIYILDNKEIFKELANGVINKDLASELSMLIDNEIVIRMDIDTSDQQDRQMLPRSNFSEIENAFDWIMEKAKDYISKLEMNPIFIIHSFIPAKSSIFAFAKPSGRKVLVESLWGLPEGLYYFSHDKYKIDTMYADMHNAKKHICDFNVEIHKNFKSLFVSPDKVTREWKTKQMAAKFGWQRCVASNATLKNIAIKSREIAEITKKPISIMWFVDIDEGQFGVKALPWHHEEIPFNFESSRPYELKYPSDTIFTVSYLSDIERLEEKVRKKDTTVKVIKIIPKEDSLLRNVSAITRIGRCAQDANCLIRLEGGVLSHAFYQLKRTGASVEIRYPFDDDAKPEFYKLVRDKIPENIANKGEFLEVAYFNGADKLKLLNDKLFEESLEVCSAKNIDELCEELADVQEILDAIASHIEKSRDDIVQIQERKSSKAGKFETGAVLLKTYVPRAVEKDNALVEFGPIRKRILELDRVYKKSKKVSTVNDYRKKVNEALFDISLSVLNDEWEVVVPEDFLDKARDQKAQLKVIGLRDGGKLKIRLSLREVSYQGSLFEEKLKE